MEGEPAELGDGEAERGGDVGRGREQRQPELLEALDVARRIAETRRDAAAEEDDVAPFSLGDAGGPALLALLRLALLLLLERGLLAAELGDGVLGGGLADGVRVGARVAMLEPEVADAVRFVNLLLSQKAAENQAAIDEAGALVGGGRDDVDAPQSKRSSRERL